MPPAQWEAGMDELERIIKGLHEDSIPQKDLKLDENLVLFDGNGKNTNTIRIGQESEANDPDAADHSITNIDVDLA